jgi:hypothetical protein
VRESPGVSYYEFAFGFAGLIFGQALQPDQLGRHQDLAIAQVIKKNPDENSVPDHDYSIV